MKQFKMLLAAGALLASGASTVLQADNCECTLDDCATTSFHSNLAINPCRKLLANFIDPVTVDSDLALIANYDASASTCFSGNIGVNEDRSLWVNRICPVQDVTPDCAVCDERDRQCAENENGTLVLCGSKVIVEGDLFVNGSEFSGGSGSFNPCIDQDVFITNGNRLCVNSINPVSTCQSSPCSCDPCGTTCFSGKVGIPKELLVNTICPMYIDGCGECKADHSSKATTCFTGNVHVEKRLWVDGSDIKAKLDELCARIAALE